MGESVGGCVLDDGVTHARPSQPEVRSWPLLAVPVERVHWSGDLGPSQNACGQCQFKATRQHRFGNLGEGHKFNCVFANEKHQGQDTFGNLINVFSNIRLALTHYFGLATSLIFIVTKMG